MKAQDIENYLHHLKMNVRATPATVSNYRSTIREFASYLGDREFTTQAVSEFLAQIENPSSSNTKGVRINGLAEYLGIPLSLVRAKEIDRPIEALTSTQISKLLKAIYKRNPEFGHIAAVLAGTGLRFDEFISLTGEEFRTDEDETYLEILGKGRKLRFVPLVDETLEAYQRLQFPFGKSSRKRMAFRECIAEAGKEVGIKVHIHPHLLRASYISILLNEQDADSAHVAKLVGHSNITTMVKHYYKPSIKKLSDVVRKKK